MSRVGDWLDVLFGVPPQFDRVPSVMRQRPAALGPGPGMDLVSTAMIPAEADVPPPPPPSRPARALEAALSTARTALLHSDQHCRYHGQDFERLGMWMGQPRCDSCKQPWRISRALIAIDAAENG